MVDRLLNSEHDGMSTTDLNVLTGQEKSLNQSRALSARIAIIKQTESILSNLPAGITLQRFINYSDVKFTS